MAISGFKTKPLYNAVSGFNSKLGFSAASGFSPDVNPVSLLPTISFSAEQAKALGYTNYQNVDALPFLGNNPNGIAVDQSTEANQPILRIEPTYAASGFLTAASNTLLNNGQGVVSEGDATNFLQNSGLVNDGANISDWDVLGAISSTQTIENYNEITFISSDERNYARYDTFTPTATTTYTFSAFISNASGVSIDQLIRGASFSGSSQTWFVDGIQQVGNFVLEGSAFVENVISFGADVDGTFRFGAGTTLRATGQATFSRVQLEESNRASSWILTPVGSTVTRQADSITSNTNEAFIDNPETATVPCVLGDESAGSGWNFGVNTANNYMGFDFDQSVAGKYNNLVTVDWVGSVFWQPSNGARVLIVNNLTIRRVVYTKLTNTMTGVETTDAEIQAGFQNTGDNSNPFKIDFTNSGYAGDTAAMIALRNVAGDTGPFLGLPTNDFVWEVEFTALDNPSTGIIVENRLFSAPRDTNSLTRENGGFQYAYRDFTNATTRIIQSSTIADISNRRWLLRVTKSSLTGVKFEVFENNFIDSKTEAAFIEDVCPWVGIKDYASRQNGVFTTNIILHKETMTNLDGSIVYSNFTPEDDGAGAYGSIDSDVNDFSMTNETLSPKNDTTFTKVSEDVYLDYSTGDSLREIAPITQSSYGVISKAVTAYPSDIQELINSLSGDTLARSLSSGEIEFDYIYNNFTTSGIYNDGIEREYIFAVGGDGSSVFAQIWVNGVKDALDSASGPLPAPIPAYTPVNEQKLTSYQVYYLTEPVADSAALDALVEGLI